MMQRSRKIRAILLYSGGHLGSTIVFNLLNTAPEIDIVGVMRARPIPKLKKGKSALGKYLHKIGYQFALTLYFQWVVQKIIMLVLRTLPFFAHSSLIPCAVLAKQNKIEIFNCENINTPEAMEFIKKHQPDIIISAYFSQIIEAEILNLPKHGVWNIHPGYLPKYRGALSYFWVLKNNEKKAGVTIHRMDEGIDTGGILERKEFKIAEGSTQQQVLAETALIGGRLVQKLVRKLIKYGSLKPIDVSHEEEKYYPMPEENDFFHYKKNRAYYRVTDLLKIMLAGIKNRRLRKHKTLKPLIAKLVPISFL